MMSKKWLFCFFVVFTVSTSSAIAQPVVTERYQVIGAPGEIQVGFVQGSPTNFSNLAAWYYNGKVINVTLANIYKRQGLPNLCTNGYADTAEYRELGTLNLLGTHVKCTSAPYEQFIDMRRNGKYIGRLPVIQTQ